MGYIYKVTNKVNGKMYIGQTTRTIEQRWKQHVYSSFSDSTFDKGPFHLAIKKYGVEAFIVEQVEKCRDEDLNSRETYWIRHFNTLDSGYNITIGGEHPLRWDGKDVLPLWDKGLSVKEIAKELGISCRMVSERLDAEGISVAEKIARGQKIGGVSSRLPVYMYDRDGNYIAEFASKHEAAKAIGFNGKVNNRYIGKSTICGYQFRRYKVDKLDTVVEPHEHEVHQYTLDGVYVATYSSLRKAANAIGDSAYGTSIGAACSEGRRAQAYGFRWSFDKVDKLPKLPPMKKCRAVVRVSLDGKERKEYCSAAQAGRENGVSASVIIDVCRGKQQHSAGYCWEYTKVG